MENTLIISCVEDFLKDQLLCVAKVGARQDKVVIVTVLPLLPTRERELRALLARNSRITQVTEIIYKEDLKMSLNGYGFVRQNEIIRTDSITPKQRTIFNAYRQSFSYFAGPSTFLAGSQQDYRGFVELAQKTATAILLTNYKSSTFTLIDFSKELIDGNIIGLPAGQDMEDYISQKYWPIVAALTKEGVLQREGYNFQVVKPVALKLPYVKDYEQLLLEQQYLGVHESTDAWKDFTGKIMAAGLAAYQTERPLEYQTPVELQAHVDSSLPRDGADSLEALVADMSSLVNQYSINQSTVNFMAFPESGNSKGAVAAAMLTPLWNQNLISVDKSAPLATFIEVQVIQWLRQIVGYDCEPTVSAENIGGIAATGGVMSNTNGLLVARSRVFAESRRKGLTGIKKKPYLLIADKTLEHYSHKAAFWWLGLGEDNVIPVKSNGFNFDIDDLKHKIVTYNTGDNVVVAVVCLAGDSRTTTVQNIAQIYAETSKHNIWLHVDACQGGVGLFSSKKDTLCADYKLADSISIDPHKGLAIPYSSSFCLFKDQAILQTISKSTDITIAKGSYDIGQVTPFLGSRPFDSLKIWALLKYHGLNGLRKNVDYRIELTKQWADYLNQSDSFISMNDPELTAISFSISPQKLELSNMDSNQLSIINKRLHDNCYKAGWLTVHGYDLVDYEDRLGLAEDKPLRVLGTNFGNVLLDKNHFSKILGYMEAQLQIVLKEMADEVIASSRQEADAMQAVPANAKPSLNCLRGGVIPIVKTVSPTLGSIVQFS
jgi:glutamate/tyrosine decarboxylase-like PLP-dependent enzyme